MGRKWKALKSDNIKGFLLPEGYAVMVGFMCQLDWATECPDIWPNIILNVSVRVFGDEINI